MANDSGGNAQVDFVWGNKPVDPAGTREDAFYPTNWGGYPASPPATVAVPDLRGKTFANAVTALTSATLGNATGGFNSTNEPVWGQQPLPGSKVAPGTKVMLIGTPSTSDTSQKIAVPNVVGVLNATAKSTLSGLGFVGTGAVATVAVQNPAAGALVAYGTSVALS
jgi:beta-lactam-binding protein with PASTA domain